MKRFVIKIKKVADLLFSFRLSRKKDLCLSIWKLRISHGSFTTWWPAETATAAGTLAASAASAHSGTKFQESAKIKIKVLILLMPGKVWQILKMKQMWWPEITYVNMLKLAWKKSWNYFRETNFWRVLAIWNYCAAASAALASIVS